MRVYPINKRFETTKPPNSHLLVFSLLSKQYLEIVFLFNIHKESLHVSISIMLFLVGKQKWLKMASPQFDFTRTKFVPRQVLLVRMIREVKRVRAHTLSGFYPI